MANNLEQESFTPTGGCISSSNDNLQMRRWRGSPNIAYDAKPLSRRLPEEVCGTVEEASGRCGGKPIKAVPISFIPPKEEEANGRWGGKPIKAVPISFVPSKEEEASGRWGGKPIKAVPISFVPPKEEEANGRWGGKPVKAVPISFVPPKEEEASGRWGGKPIKAVPISFVPPKEEEASGRWGGKPIKAVPISFVPPKEEEASGQWGGKPIKAVPISFVPPKEEVLGNGSGRKRKSKFVGQIEKDFTLLEVFQSDNLQEIIQNRETAEFTLDSQQILEKLKGWTIVSHRRQENSLQKTRIDKVYQHPTSNRLRSVIQVQKFIVESSYIKKAEDNAEGGSREAAVGGSQLRPLASGKRNINLEIYQRLTEFFNHGVQNPS